MLNVLNGTAPLLQRLSVLVYCFIHRQGITLVSIKDHFRTRGEHFPLFDNIESKVRLCCRPPNL